MFLRHICCPVNEPRRRFSNKRGRSNSMPGTSPATKTQPSDYLPFMIRQRERYPKHNSTSPTHGLRQSRIRPAKNKKDCCTEEHYFLLLHQYRDAVFVLASSAGCSGRVSDTHFGEHGNLCRILSNGSWPCVRLRLNSLT